MERMDWKQDGRCLGSGGRRVVFGCQSGAFVIETFLGVARPALPARNGRCDLSTVDGFRRDDVTSGFWCESPMWSEGVVAFTKKRELGSVFRRIGLEIPVHVFLFQHGVESFEQT